MGGPVQYHLTEIAKSTLALAVCLVAPHMGAGTVIKKKRCPTCKKYFRPSNPRQKYCIECGIKKVVRVNNQLRRKKGKYYEKWRNSLIRSLQKKSKV